MAGVLYIEHSRDALCRYTNLMVSDGHSVFIAYDKATVYEAMDRYGPDVGMVVTDVLFMKAGHPEHVDLLPDNLLSTVVSYTDRWRPIVALTGETSPYAQVDSLRQTCPNVVASVQKGANARLIAILRKCAAFAPLHQPNGPDAGALGAFIAGLP